MYRLDKLGAGSVLKIPSIIFFETLEPPEFVALYDITRHLPEERVDVTKTLGGVVEAYVIMATGEDRIEKQRVYIGLEIPAVHLNRKLITQNEGDGEGVILIVIFPVMLCCKYDLLKAHELLIRNGESHVGDHLHPLGDELTAPGTPDLFAVILLIRRDHTMDGAQGLALAEQTGIRHELTSTI